MARIKLEDGGKRARFNCPGCKQWHVIGLHDAAISWTWNGSLDLPTFSPSVLVRTGHYCNDGEVVGNCACDFQQRYPDQEPWPWPCTRCHSFVTDGRIQFLGDCSHALAGQTIDLPEIEA